MTALPRRQRAARGWLLAGAALVLSGCSLIPVEENTFESAPLPAISAEATATVLAEIDTAVSAANAARDPALLEEVAAGPLLEVGSARYALDTLTDPEDAEPAAPVAHSDPTVFVPRFADYPQWFVVAGASQPDGPVALEVLTRTDAAARWFTLIAPELLPDVEFPVLALDEAGYVVPLDSSDLGDVAGTATGAVTQHAAALSGTAAPAVPDATGTPTGTPGATTTAPTPSARPISPAATTPPATASPSGSATPAAPAVDLTAALAADPWTAARREADAAAAAAVGAAATVTSTYAPGAVLEQALRTDDGGALVFYALTGQRAYAVTPTYFLELDATTAAIVGTDEVAATLTEDWTAQVALYLPPDETGTPRVVAARWDRTGLAGS